MGFRTRGETEAWFSRLNSKCLSRSQDGEVRQVFNELPLRSLEMRTIWEVVEAREHSDRWEIQSDSLQRGSGTCADSTDPWRYLNKMSMGAISWHHSFMVRFSQWEQQLSLTHGIVLTPLWTTMLYSTNMDQVYALMRTRIQRRANDTERVSLRWWRWNSSLK